MHSYAHKLSPAEKDWLNRFSQEYVCANPNHKGEKIHTSKEDWKAIYLKNNGRNRCIFTKEKAQGCLNYLNDYLSETDFDLLNASILSETSESPGMDEDLPIVLASDLPEEGSILLDAPASEEES